MLERARPAGAGGPPSLHPLLRLGWKRGMDLAREWIEREAEGFHARLVQHECDHLDGVLFPDRLADLHQFGFNEELEAAGMIPPLRG